MVIKRKIGLIANYCGQTVFLSSFNRMPNPYFITQTPEELRERLPHLIDILPSKSTFIRNDNQRPGSYERGWYANFTVNIDKADLRTEHTKGMLMNSWPQGFINQLMNSRVFQSAHNLLINKFSTGDGDYLEAVKLDNRKIDPREIKDPQKVYIEEKIDRAVIYS